MRTTTIGVRNHSKPAAALSVNTDAARMYFRTMTAERCPVCFIIACFPAFAAAVDFLAPPDKKASDKTCSGRAVV
jgi:hypothetical protein